MRMVSLDEAMQITGHVNKRSFHSWVARFNQRNPGHVILRRRGKVDADTLLDGIRRETAPTPPIEEYAG